MAAQNFPDNVLYNIDNLEVLRGMNSETVDLIATDPPFNTKLSPQKKAARTRAANKKRKEEEKQRAARERQKAEELFDKKPLAVCALTVRAQDTEGYWTKRETWVENQVEYAALRSREGRSGYVDSREEAWTYWRRSHGGDIPEARESFEAAWAECEAAESEYYENLSHRGSRLEREAREARARLFQDPRIGWRRSIPSKMPGGRREWLNILDRQEWRCIACRLPFSPHRPATLDHRKARIRGGKHELENFQAMCKGCNSSKHSRTEEEWVASMFCNGLWGSAHIRSVSNPPDCSLFTWGGPHSEGFRAVDPDGQEWFVIAHRAHRRDAGTQEAEALIDEIRAGAQRLFGLGEEEVL